MLTVKLKSLSEPRDFRTRRREAVRTVTLPRRVAVARTLEQQRPCGASFGRRAFQALP